MILWIVMAALAALAALSLLVPLYRARSPALPASAAAQSIYRDQLEEVDREVSRGTIAETEAKAAKTEIARRLVRADPRDAKASPPRGGLRRMATIAVVAMPMAALALYLVLGSPELPDRPLAARLTGPLENQDINALVARFEGHLSANPRDGRAWGLIAPVYVRLGRYGDAVTAYTRVIEILGSNAERETNLGDAMMRATEGVVTPAARAAFRRANKLDPEAVQPRFYLAVALGQEGKTDEAIAAWKALLDSAPAGAAWVPIARAELARLERIPESGPTAADIEEAARMSAEEREAMIAGMVESLAARLDGDPGDANGWARLIRSYMVLDRVADARAALVRARSALASDAGKLAIVDSAAREAGLVD
jgi:cytochrome c-type biogenesis protein CcmH